ISKSRFLPIVLSSHTVSSVARVSWLRMAEAIASLCPFTGTKVSPCEFRHNARTGSERFLDTACEQRHTACQKRSGWISACEGAGNSGVYALACWLRISPLTENTTALHLLEPSIWLEANDTLVLRTTDLARWFGVAEWRTELC